MKDVLLFVSILCICSVYGGSGRVEMADKILRTLRKCSRHHQLKLSDIEGTLRRGQLPQSEQGKCFVACTLKEFGLITNDNKFDPEKSFALNEMRFKNPDDLQKANDITRNCEKILLGDYENECEFGLAVANCGLKNSREVGIISYDLW